MIENQNIQSSNVENWLAVCFIVNDPIKLFPNAFHWQRNELDLRIELFSSFNEMNENQKSKTESKLRATFRKLALAHPFVQNYDALARLASQFVHE